MRLAFSTRLSNSVRLGRVRLDPSAGDKPDVPGVEPFDRLFGRGGGRSFTRSSHSVGGSTSRRGLSRTSLRLTSKRRPSTAIAAE
jgi:hypothetical protein